MNEILAKNLECIKQYNEKLVKEIEEIEAFSVPIELCITEKDEHNVCIDGIPVHSQVCAQDEAEKIYATLPHNTESSIHVTFGLGLGYLFQELCDKAKGYIILYEENIELLRAVFEVVDFSQTLLKNNVKVATNLDELKDAYYSFFMPDSKISLTFLNYYKNNFSAQLGSVLKELELAQGIAQGSYKFRQEKSKDLTKNLVSKLNEKIKSPCITVLKDKFKDMPAIVVAAGPSLYKNLDLIKEYQDKAIIFCVGTAYKVLIANGIKPHFVSIIESIDVFTQVDYVDTIYVNLITDAAANTRILDKQYKNIFVYPSRENPINWWYLNLINEADTSYETKGTVAYNALYSAYKCGCNPIILIGQDLAYVDDCCYAQNSTHAALKCRFNDELKKWEVYFDDLEQRLDLMVQSGHSREFAEQVVFERLKGMTERLINTKDKHGKDIRTDISFVLFAKYLSDFGHRFSNERTLINATPQGLKLDNFIDADLKTTLEKYTKDNIKIDEIIEKAKKSYNINYDDINKKLSNEIEIIGTNLKEIRKIEDNLKDLKVQLQNRQTPLPKTQAAMRKCIDAYVAITTQNVSILLTNLTYAQKEQVNNFLNNNSQTFTLSSIMELCSLLNNYFEVTKNEAPILLQELKQMKEKINENAYTTC